MPSFCAVVGCSNKASKTQNIGYYRIPTAVKFGSDQNKKLAQRRREKWIQALRRSDLTETKIKYARICSVHFLSGKPAELEDVNNPDWIPTIQMGYKTAGHDSNLARWRRAKQRTEAAKVQTSDKSDLCEGEVQDFVSDSKPTYEELAEALKKAKEEINVLKKELRQFKLLQEHFMENDNDVHYFTGFPEYSYLENFLSSVEQYLPPSVHLSKFQQVLMTLMRLRLNFHFAYLARLFQCHRTTISRTFDKVIDIIYHRFKTFIEWPQKENLIINMPQCFKNVFGLKTTVVIDCFEIFIEKPKSLDAAAKTWSNYKHHHTVKFLIGISPQGCIIFISCAWGGRASDKYITENCGFLNHLEAGDLVIADWGFAIDDSVQLYLAEVKYPAFLKGKKQLDPVEIQKTKKLASVRINVERVIGLLKNKFNILRGVFPMKQLKKGDDFALIDKIVTVCCCIVNICPGIVPIE